MSKIEYPKTHEEPVSEDYHGTTVCFKLIVFEIKTNN